MTYLATVKAVYQTGRHGCYAKAVSPEISGSVTFSLKRPVWKSKKMPNPNDMVVLSDIRKTGNGWRAMTGRFYRPETKERKET